MTVRVVSKRKGGIEAAPDELVIDLDRSHPTLGNPFILSDWRDDKERDRVIEQYKSKLDEDWTHDGPMRRSIQALAARVAAGEHLALRCWCAPRRCHVEIVRDRIAECLGLSPSDLKPPQDPPATVGVRHARQVFRAVPDVSPHDADDVGVSSASSAQLKLF